MELRELTRLAGVSGDEGAVRNYILEQTKPLADEVKIDRMGNVLAFKRGTAARPNHALLAAHMDEVGLIVLGFKDDGLIVYEPVGGIDARIMVSKRMRVGKDLIPGVIGCKAIHLQSPDERKQPLTHKQLFVDIGAKDREAAQKLVSLGDYISFEPGYVEFGDGFVKDKALDDRVGCYNLLRLLAGRYPCDVTFAFTVQEEVGLRGATVAARQVKPDCALVLEATTANDLGKVDPHFRVCVPGRGAAISFMDNASIAHPALNRRLRELADARGIAWQVKAFVAGGNDAGALQREAGAVPVCPVSIPCRNIHSPANVANANDIEAQYRLAEAFLNEGAAIESSKGR
ncbi:MAG: M42 family peptidase [Eubacteriales bacterium]|nr:M42 family peptidase [Christensenellaceae bacterium]MEA5064830.1 M42 family peptidase [Eubacteriales bacterium]